ncbi:MAG TPA: C-GCAxxG-C-C family protein [Bacillota bacterium]|jgi:C_GCAxxG_C_C family probable redox protein
MVLDKPKSRGSDLGEIAVARFLAGYNCAEATFMTLAEALGFAGDYIPSVATGFGGGLGHTGLACGCLTGGIMAIGLAAGHKHADDLAGKERAINQAMDFRRAFEAAIGEINCRAMTGYDLTDPAQFEEYKVKVKPTRCAGYMRQAVALATKPLGLED